MQFFKALSLLFAKRNIMIGVDSYKFYVGDFMDVWSIKEIILDKCYERVRQVKKNDIVVDVEASIADFSVYASKKAKQVYAYEMNKTKLSLAKKNLAINNCTNIILKNSKVISLHEIVKDLSVCDFLKIDCEGGEYKIFQDVNKNDMQKLRHIAIEIHLFNKVQVKKFQKLSSNLRKYGFIISLYDSPVHSYLKFLFASSR